jgi:hypothetical protein
VRRFSKLFFSALSENKLRITMNIAIELLKSELSQIINGEPCPSFQSHEFAQILCAIYDLTNPDANGEIKQHQMADIGLEAIKLINNRLLASMASEHTIAVMRDNGKPLC